MKVFSFSLVATLFLSFVIMTNAYSQAFPVTLATQSVPPHSGRLSDLVAPGLERLGVTMVLNDREELSYQVRLRFTIEGQGITISSKENFNPSPITLSFGVPTQLSGVELSEYLDLDNLNFSGITREAYLQQGGLPEGFYTLCFTAYDFDRSSEEAVSFQSCTGISAILQDPPVILSPIGQQLVTSPQNLGVQWQERHVGGFPVEYTVQIFNFNPNQGLTADLIFEFEQPIVEQVINMATSTLIGPADPPLVRGGQYIMRVRARDITQLNAFQNDGWSAPEYFTYGDDCEPPTGIEVNVLNTNEAALNWQPLPGYNTYLIRYREFGRVDANWYEDETPIINHTLSGLSDGTTYEYQIQTLCNGTSPGSFSSLDTFTTEAIVFDPADFDCSEDFSLPTPSNTTPIASLEFGDVLNLGGFEFRITSADPSEEDPEAWDGTGLVIVPWLGLKIISEFEGLYVNEMKEVYDGEVTAVSEGLDGIPDFQSPEEVAAELQATPMLCGAEYEGGGDEEEEPEEEEGGEEEEEEEAEEEEEEEPMEVTFDMLMANLGGVTLPVSLGEAPNMIAIDEMVFTPSGASLSAFMSAEIPVANQYVAFGLTQGQFHPGGMLGNSNLILLNDIPVNLGDKILLNIKAGDNTYVSWNCQGISSIGLEGEVAFCRDLLVPVDESTFERLDDGYVTASFVTSMPAWGEFVAEMSMSPFELPKLEDWTWSVESAVFDLSAEVTPEAVTFPEDYSHADVESEEGADNPLWTGFYLAALNIKLPEKFNDSDPDTPIQLGATDIIIDYTGFSGNVYGVNVLSVEDGRVGSWGFSIDSLGITVQSNQFKSAGMAGVLDISAFESPLAYGGVIQPEDGYFFSLALTEDVEMDAWRANMTLAADSEISMEYLTEDKSFTASAILHGSASFSPSVGKDKSRDAPDKMTLPTVNFENFELSTGPPYLVNIGSWELVNGDGEQPLLSGFPLTINSIGLSQEENTVSFMIDAAINLVGADDSGFSAGGSISLNSLVEIDDSGKQVWTFDGVEVGELFLDVSGPGYALFGTINFYEDTPGYGSGFRAMVEATFEPKLSVGAVAQFGEVDGYRYWFADAMASFEPGIAIGTTGLALYGFGGGASYHMQRGSLEDLELPEPEEGEEEELPEDIGLSLSGTQYIPNQDYGIGIRARIGIGLVNPNMFNSDLMLEIIFNSSGGLASIAFEGDARFMTPPPTGEDEEDPALRCVLAMEYDFENESFHAQLDLYLNVAKGLITGAYEENLAGTGIIHADPELWYIHLGTPDNRIMISYSLPGLEGLGGSSAEDAPDDAGDDDKQIDWGSVGLLFTAYLDAGMNLPPFPDLPPEVIDILGDGDYSLINQDDPRFQSGTGLMFGAAMHLNIPELKFLAFYAEFAAGAGFDVMMINLGEAARCAGNENDPNPIGVNGWYAMGQIWAYVEGAIGIKVNVFGIKGNFEILSIAAAAVLQAKLPNPMWMRGIVGGKYSILGGLVKGNCRFEFEVGQKCEIVGADVLAGIELIGSTQPNANTDEDVDVFIRPQVTFNLPIGDIFELQDDEGNVTQYRPSLYQFDIIDNNTGLAINGDYEWNETNDVVVFTPSDILTGNASYKLLVNVRFDKRAEGTATWTPLFNDSGQRVEQSADVDFTTGPAPDYIPHHNVAYSYPVIDQFNFLRTEANSGYIQLKQGQPYLFETEPSFALDAADWDQKLIFYQNGSQAATAGFSYNNSGKRVNFAIPGAQLATNTVSRVAIVNVPANTGSGVDDNVQDLEQELLSYQNDDSDGEFTTIIIQAKVAEGQLSDLKEKDVYTSNFRTSYYSNFNQKMSGLDLTEQYSDAILIDPTGQSSSAIQTFGAVLNGNEYFDLFDQDGYNNGGQNISPLIQPVADLSVTGNDWFNSKMAPNMYNHVPVPPSIALDWRDPAEYGEVPSKAVFISQGGTPHRLTEDDVLAGTANPPLRNTVIVYQLPYYMIMDYFEYQQDVAGYYVTNPSMSKELVDFLNWGFAYPDYGNYRVRFEYTLPGQSTPTSSVDLDLLYGNSN